MKLDRRDLLKGGAALSLTMALPGIAGAQSTFAPKPGKWRDYQIVTRLELANTQGPAQAWIPVPSVNEGDWFRSGESTWATNAKSAVLARDEKYGAGFVHAQWAQGEQAPVIEVTSRVTTQDRAVDLTKPGTAALRRRTHPLHRLDRAHSDRRHRETDLGQHHRRRDERRR